MDEVQHKCPKCGTMMNKLDPACIDEIRQQHDVFGQTGPYPSAAPTATTERYVTNTTSSSVITTTITGLDAQVRQPPTITGVPYECPKCRHRMSFRS